MRVENFNKAPMERLSESIQRHYLTGQNATVALFDYQKGAVIQKHQHASEQFSYVLQGKIKITADGKEYILTKGEILRIPPNLPHSIEALEHSRAFDVFSPIRQDWVRGEDSYLRGSAKPVETDKPQESP